MNAPARSSSRAEGSVTVGAFRVVLDVLVAGPNSPGLGDRRYTLHVAGDGHIDLAAYPGQHRPRTPAGRLSRPDYDADLIARREAHEVLEALELLRWVPVGLEDTEPYLTGAGEHLLEAELAPLRHAARRAWPHTLETEAPRA